MFLAPAATSAPFTAVPQARNFPGIAKPALSSKSSQFSSLVAPQYLASSSQSAPSHASSSMSHGEVSSDVLIAEEQVGRHQARGELPSSLSLLLSSDLKSMDDRIRYVHQCLQAIRAQPGAKGFTGPQEELAYAIQQLESAISSSSAATPKQRQQLHAVIEHATRDERLPAHLRPAAPSAHHEHHSAPHRIVSEDVIPHGATSAQLYHSDNSNMLGYRKAAEESERLVREGEARRVEYAVRCLQAVEERQRLEEQEQRLAAKQAGPEEQSAYSMISRQARAQALRSKL